MNELIQVFQGKRVEITGDISMSCMVGTILSVGEGWFLMEDDKGRRTLINTVYVSSIREKPKKTK